VTRIRLRHIHRFRDRHGQVRLYLRVPGAKAVALPGPEGSPAFMAAYTAAIAKATPPEPGAARTLPGSLDALAVSWYRSAAFVQLGANTQHVYRRILERMRAEHGTKPVRLLEHKHVRAMLAARAATPAAANHVLRILRQIMRHAVESGWRDDDPTTGVRKLRETGPGIPTASEAQIAAYEAHWAVGTRERLALALLLYTGQRRADVVRMGPQHRRTLVLDIDGRPTPVEGIDVVQQKTRARLWIPLHPELRAAIDAAPAGHLAFLTTQFGQPFTPAGFSQRFKLWAKAAGADGMSPHQLRKAAARRLAEAGCSASQIASITGHRTLAEVERYTRAADQAQLASDATARIRRPGT
jgi:integrase